MAHIKNAILVSSVNGLYDEKTEAVIMNISDRKRCWKLHDFINASLCWEKKISEKKHFSIWIESPKTELLSGWGQGCGGIRYCRKCKLIDCIHLWEEPRKAYEVEEGKYYSVGYSIDTCRVCNRRILRSSWGSCNPNMKALEIISKAASEIGKNVQNYPSGWHVELPVYISEILDSQGEEAAMQAARQAFSGSALSDAVMNIIR